MNNEEKNLPENEISVDNDIKQEKGKLPKGALIGIICGAAALVLAAVILIIALAGGNKCEGHVDADDDYLCDNCGENYDDGDEAPSTNGVSVTFKVQLDNGEALPGLQFTLSRGETSVDFVSGADGTVNGEFEAGPYAINYKNLPAGCVADVFGVKITEETTTVTLTVTDNNPDGSEQKPFFIADNETEINIPAGSEIYYWYRGSTKYVNIYVEGIEIHYNGETFTSSEGSVTALLEPELGSGTLFSLKNVTSEAIVTTMNLVAPLGSNENPNVMDSNTATAFISSEEIVYYKWVADKSGILLLNCDVENNNFSLTKILENDISITTQTEGKTAAYISVTEGESILIGASMLDSATKVLVPFSVSVYAGTESEPVPVYGSEIDLSFGANSSVVFKLADSSYIGKMLSVSDESEVSVIYGSETYTGNSEKDILVELTAGNNTFTVINDSDHINGITFKISLVE